MLISVPIGSGDLLNFGWRHFQCADGKEDGRHETEAQTDDIEKRGERHA